MADASSWVRVCPVPDSSRAPPETSVPWPNQEKIGTERAELFGNFLTCSRSHRHHANHGGNPDNDAKHGEHAAHFVGVQCSQSNSKGLKKGHWRPPQRSGSGQRYRPGRTVLYDAPVVESDAARGALSDFGGMRDDNDRRTVSMKLFE